MSQAPLIPRYKSLRRTFSFVHEPIPVFSDYIKAYGDTFQVYLGGVKKVLVTANPKVMRHVLQKNHKNYSKSEIQTDLLAQYVGNGLLTSDGDYWFKQRRLIQPGFHKQRIKSLVGLIRAAIDKQMDTLESERGKELDFYPRMMDIAFSIIGNAMFSEYATQNDLAKIEESIYVLQQFIVKRARQPFMYPVYWMNGKLKKYNGIARDIEGLVLKIIRTRKQLPKQPDDLLGMLIDTRYEDDNTPMSEEQLLWESNILFVAGHETTANALCWMLYLLAKNPQYVDSLKKEIKDHVGVEELSFDVLMKMPLLNGIILEAMRMFPPAWILDRVAHEDDHAEGIDIPKGTMVLPLVYHAHYREEDWDAPDVFRPERFIQTKNQAAYFPFGAGPRMCIGNNFAMLEMQIFLVQFFKKFELEVTPNTSGKLKALITIKPEKGMRLKLI